MKKTALAGIVVLVGMTLSPAPTAAHGDRAQPNRPCQYEDSSFCVWDAKHQGNGKGRSLQAQGKGEFQFITHKRAYRLIKWHKQGFRPFRDIGSHHHCYIKVGDTSIVKCLDGFRTTS